MKKHLQFALLYFVTFTLGAMGGGLPFFALALLIFLLFLGNLIGDLLE